jgi:hypothetical protein
VTTIDWWALIGPVPTAMPTEVVTVPIHQMRRYAGPEHLGTFRLRSVEQPLDEFVRLEPRTMDGCMYFSSWPVIVEGTSDEQEWPRVVQSVAPGLHRVSALISLAWGEPWQVRTAPTNHENLPPRVPTAWPPPAMFERPPVQTVGEDEELPTWVNEAWYRLDETPGIGAALDAWHEGIHLLPLHPSFALVAFAGAIETAARAQGFNGSSAEVFWNGVERVATSDEFDLVREKADAWRRRCATAHGGRMHGIETVLGAPLFLRVDLDAVARGGTPDGNEDATDEIHLFVYELVPAIARLSRTLVLEALNEGS